MTDINNKNNAFSGTTNDDMQPTTSSFGRNAQEMEPSKDHQPSLSNAVNNNKRKPASSNDGNDAAEEELNAGDDDPRTTASPKKRPKVETATTHPSSREEQLKVETVVTPTSNTAAADRDVAPGMEAAEASDAPLDLANTLGYKDGDRIEVQWEIHNDDDDDDSETKTTKTVWWNATLLEHDGRTTDSVAIRSLLYDARPDLGFPEPSKEDVVFLGHDLLVSPHDDAVQLKYKREGLTEEENQLLVCNDDQLDDQLNQIVMGTLEKNRQAWKAMPPAAQAAIAEKMQKMKEKMKEKLRALGPHVVITSETIQQLLAQSF